MPYLIMLIVVAIIGFTIASHLNKPELPPPEETTTTAPQVPTKPQDLEQFSQDINQYLQDEATKTDEKIDELSQ